MAQSAKIAAAGIAAAAANAITGDALTGLTGAGSTQATALAINASISGFTTVAAATGAILPPGNAGDSFVVYNAGANTLTVYPPLGAAINSGAANAGFSVATTKSCSFSFASATLIFANLSA